MYFNELVGGFTTTKIISAYTIFTEKITNDVIELSNTSDPEVLRNKLQELEDICNESKAVDGNLVIALNAQKENITQCYRAVFRLKPPTKTPTPVAETAKS
jgi:hypothetical protein